MPSIFEAFPSKYLTGNDLSGKERTVTIGSCELAALIAPGEHKPLLHLVGIDRGMVLNKTNAQTLANLLGEDYTQWHGKQIVLVPTPGAKPDGTPLTVIRIKGAPGPVLVQQTYGFDSAEPTSDDIPW